MSSTSLPAADCFALLDDSSADAQQPRTRLYTGLVESLSCHRAADLPGVLARMQSALAQGRHALGLFHYELGARMQRVHEDCMADVPLAQILVFEHCAMLSAADADNWLRAREDGGAAGIAQLAPSVSEQQFAAAISRIHAYIEAGDTYQINYTYRLRFDAYGAPSALYRRLRARQPVPYGTLVLLPDGGAVLSLSPELFVRHCEGRLTARPMKGTAPASGEAQEDARRAQALAADEKNRAENLMIVDLLRNDLGRVARFGSVQVPRLFEVERYAGVLQMTSTVEAELKPDTTLAAVFDALFPCGSITGAPKRRTMQIIDELEPDARDLYTGAIGWFDAPSAPRALGDFCLSVAIRTLVLQPPLAGVRRGELGVGAGIVHDSVAGDEYAECALKARFLAGLPPEFALIETMFARHSGCRHLELHLARLAGSARYFGFTWDEAAVRDGLNQACAALGVDETVRLRLALQADGRVEIQCAPLVPPVSPPQPVGLLLAADSVRSDDLFLRHKTTQRMRYDAAWREAESRGAFDMLFFNERDELTEGARSNVFLRLDGRWVTPPLSSGLLPGVMRSVLLSDPNWQAQERVLSRADLMRAEQIVVCNALRGVLQARLLPDQARCAGR